MAKIKVSDLRRIWRLYEKEEISYSRMVEMLNEIAAGEEQSEDDVKIIKSLLPEWVKEVPEGLDPTMYGTGTQEGDEAVKKRVDEILKRIC
jgi:hypothetical protein